MRQRARAAQADGLQTRIDGTSIEVTSVIHPALSHEQLLILHLRALIASHCQPAAADYAHYVREPGVTSRDAAPRLERTTVRPQRQSRIHKRVLARLGARLALRLEARRVRRRLNVAWVELADVLLGRWDAENDTDLTRRLREAGLRGVGGRLDPPRLAVTLEQGVPVPDEVPAEFAGFTVVIERYAPGRTPEEKAANARRVHELQMRRAQLPTILDAETIRKALSGEELRRFDERLAAIEARDARASSSERQDHPE